MIARLINKLRDASSQAVVWPSIDYELAAHRAAGRLKGKILNAGCGWRDIKPFVEGEVVNQDITWEGDDRSDVDIFSPIHNIPVPNETFDAILCIAVLEHVENPEEIIPEFYRTVKQGGYVIASIPFLQPEHKVPTDFQRYTRDGIERLFSHHGFEIVESKSLYTIYHTFHWLIYEWLHLKNSLLYKFLRITLLPFFAYLAKRSDLQSDKLATAFQVVARKRKRIEQGSDGSGASRENEAV